MTLTILKWIVVLLSFVNTGFMAFDGARALIKGDYIRPTSGEYAGRLGPWSKLVEKIGIDPMSALMKVIFVVWGLTGLMITLAVVLNVAWGYKALLVFNVCSLWYLYFGTMNCGLQIVLLLLLKVLA